MSLIDKLKVAAWRQSNWNKLFLGDNLFTEIKALQPEEIEATLERLEFYQQTLPNKLADKQWRMAQTIFNCARIANLDQNAYSKLFSYLHLFDLPGEDLDFNSVEGIESNDKSWEDFIREALDRLTWPAPINSVWAWDIITNFWGVPRKIIKSQQLTLLLLDENEQGVTANLSLNLLDAGGGAIYPDPETMSFVKLTDSFLQAHENAVAAIQHRGEWVNYQDIRWKIERQDRKPLHVLDGGSAGGAFALGIAKLLAGSKQYF